MVFTHSFFIFIILYHGVKLNNEYKVLLALLVLNFTSRYIPEVFTLRSVAYYLFYFYLGYIINKKHFIERTQAPRYRILMFFMLCGSLIACILFKRAIIVPASLFIICLYSVMTSKDNKAIQLISNNSYGIYLFHSPFVYVTYKYMIDYTPVIVVFTNIVIFGSLSILMTRGIRVSKFRFIIGE